MEPQDQEPHDKSDSDIWSRPILRLVSAIHHGGISRNEMHEYDIFLRTFASMNSIRQLFYFFFFLFSPTSWISPRP